MTEPGEAPSGELFQALVENSSDAIALLDGQGTILYSSRSSERILGFTAEERIGFNAFDHIYPEDVPAVRRAFEAALAQPGVPVSSEFRVQHRNGSVLVVEAVGVNRLSDPAVHGIVVNYRDVTDRKRAEEALRASEERLRRLVEYAHDLIYYCNPKGHFTYVNPAAERVMRYTEAELLGRHFLTLVRPDFRDRASQVYARQIVERTPSTYFEFPAVTKDGVTIWVGQHVQLLYEGDQIVAVQAIARDITRQKTAEDLLRKSEARYRSLIQGAAYGIYRTTIEGRILDANPALAAMLGYDDASELATKNMNDLYVTPGERARIVEQFQREGQRMLPVEVQWRRRDGSPITVRLTARVVNFDDGLSCFEGITEDITARRMLEEQLREAQKMEAVGRLARGVAHDFNNLLAAIVGCSDLLIARLRADDPSRIDAEEISKAAERGAALTRQLLAFSRRQALEASVFDLHAVVTGLAPILKRLAGEHVQVQLHTDGPPPRIRVEPGHVEQVLLNLVVNARDAMPEGGAIDVTVDTLELDEETAATYGNLPAGGYARLAIADNGKGMDEAIQRHVFEPFFTTKDPSKGTGLGLSIVYAIAKDAGGTVAFTSTAAGPRRGTTFEVLFPLALGA